MITIKRLEQILYKSDPMGTQCVFYKSYDEYKLEAQKIIELVKSGIPFKYAYFTVMEEMFWLESVLESMNSSYISIETEYFKSI